MSEETPPPPDDVTPPAREGLASSQNQPPDKKPARPRSPRTAPAAGAKPSRPQSKPARAAAEASGPAKGAAADKKAPAPRKKPASAAARPSAPRRKSAVVAPGSVGAGDKIASYQIEEQIGAGGMAVVYRAHDERLGRLVALKLLAPTLTADDGFRQRFIRESRSAASVDHPHIIPIYEAGDAGGALFIAMRFVQGGDVRSLLERDGPLPAARAWAIVSQVAWALDAAHAHGLIHRDVKPANMLLDASSTTGEGSGSRRADQGPHVYLSDFGISKQPLAASNITMTGQFVGTLDYIAPEQIDGSSVDGRTDLYSLGCAAFELLTGQPPFRRSQGLALVSAHLSEAPPAVTIQRPDLPPMVNAVLAAAMAKSPADRYLTCAQFAENFGRALGLAPGRAELPGSEPRGPGLAPPPHPATELAASAAAAAAAAAAALSSPRRRPQAWPPPPPRRPLPLPRRLPRRRPRCSRPPCSSPRCSSRPCRRPVPPAAYGGAYAGYQGQYAQPSAVGPTPPVAPQMPPGTGWPQQPPQQPPRRRRSGGMIAGVLAGLAAVAAAAVIAVVLIGHGHNHRPLNDAASSSSAPATSPAAASAPASSPVASTPATSTSPSRRPPRRPPPAARPFP